MTGCCAYGCSNRDSQGFLMKRFPRDPDRRRLWAIKVKRANWKPTDSSFLCEVHFTENMFELNRGDGKRMLKRDAIPTLFPHVPPKLERRRKSPVKRSLSPMKRGLLQNENICHPTKEFVSTTTIVPDDGEVANVVSMTEYDSPASSSSSNSRASPRQQVTTKEQKDIVMKYKNKYLRTLKKYRKVKNALRRLQRGSNAQPTGDNVLCAVQKVFNNVQLASLHKMNSDNKSKTVVHWDNDSIKRGLKLKFSCGSSGYDELLRQNFPFPSQRTLRRRVEHLSFNPGLLDDIFNFLEIKITSFTDNREKDCCLVLDEMSITSGKLYDVSANNYVGFVTLPIDNSTLASHALVFMLAGVNSRWKQTVAYHFTGSSVPGKYIWDMIHAILIKSHQIGLNVICVTSDMGSSNQSFWRIHGITAGRFEMTNNSFPHPSDADKKVYVMADPVHLFKNIRSTLTSNKFIELPRSILEKNGLTHPYVELSHIADLAKHQQTLRFQLAPKLHEADLMPTHFQKMKVGPATNVISHSVSSALKYLAAHLNREELLTTAVFLDMVEKWFTYMTSRHPKIALSKKQMGPYEEAIKFLHEFVDMFTNITIGSGKQWKPCQTGVLISTKSALEIQDILLESKKYSFVLMGRFTQDCVENLFSVVRSKQKAPNPVQFKFNLKLIVLSQYMCDVRNSSYEEDDRRELSDFIELMKARPTSESSAPDSQSESLSDILYQISMAGATVDDIELTLTEKNALYSIIGYLITSIKKSCKTCEDCIFSVGGTSSFNLPYDKLVTQKQFKEGSLFFCNSLTFEFVEKLEDIFIQFIKTVESQQINLKTFFSELFNTVPANHIKTCHNLKSHLINRYLTFRLKINSTNQKLVKPRFDFGSKSMNLM